MSVATRPTACTLVSMVYNTDISDSCEHLAQSLHRPRSFCTNAWSCSRVRLGVRIVREYLKEHPETWEREMAVNLYIATGPRSHDSPIFRVESDGHLIWKAAAETLDVARLRITTLMDAQLGSKPSGFWSRWLKSCGSSKGPAVRSPTSTTND